MLASCTRRPAVVPRAQGGAGRGRAGRADRLTAPSAHAAAARAARRHAAARAPRPRRLPRITYNPRTAPVTPQPNCRILTSAVRKLRESPIVPYFALVRINGRCSCVTRTLPI